MDTLNQNINKGLVIKLSTDEIERITKEPLLLAGGTIVEPGTKHAISSTTKTRAGSMKRYLGKLTLSESQSAHIANINNPNAAIFESKQLEDGFFLAFISTPEPTPETKLKHKPVIKSRSVRHPTITERVLFRTRSIRAK
ncbi:hypothetical protein [Vibrio owensii]|uniref:hypothetical protein n=1 Tax=Vibrio owensii TaxID=696485 RepID=UPI0018F18CB4|nr:hypothetical protein [Vibrio owensii]